MNKKIGLIIFLVLLSFLTSIVSPIILKEYFGQNTLPLKSLNVCGRHIIFPNQISSSSLASSRATYSSIGTTDPLGVCVNSGSNTKIDSSFAIVTEHSIYYTLQKLCLGLRFMNGNVDSTGNVYITFTHDSVSDMNNISLLMMLNPLFVEFSPTSTKSTKAYMVSYHTVNAAFSAVQNSFDNTGNFSYSPMYSSSFVPTAQNSSGNDNDFDMSYASHVSVVNSQKTLTLKFVPMSNTSCDTPFNYSGQSQLQQSDMDAMMTSGVVNLSAFYIDQIDTSYQKPSLSMSLPYDLSQNQLSKTYVFWSDYENDTSSRRSTQLTDSQKKFMNNIRIMFANYISPVFTVTFDINITKALFAQSNGGPVTFMTMYVDNGLNEFQTCAWNNISGGKNNCNVFSITAAQYPSSQNFYYLFVTTSTTVSNQYGCSGSNSSVDTLNVQVPFNSLNQNTRLVLTVTPAEKILYAECFSTATSSKKILLSRSKNCPVSQQSYDICQDNAGTGPISNVANDFATIFTQKNRQVGSQLNDIVLSYNKTVVTQTESILLGYQNFYRTYIS